MNDFYYLSHGGPGSGRYPWGSGDRPYQRLEGSKRKNGGIVGYIKSRKAKKAEEEKQKQREELLRKKEEMKRKQEEHEKNKEKVLKSGSAADVLKYQGELSNKELSEVANRLRLENDIKSYAAKDVTSALDKLKKVQSFTNVGSALAKDGIDIYNSFAAMYNASSAGRKTPLTLINKGDGGGKKKK